MALLTGSSAWGVATGAEDRPPDARVLPCQRGCHVQQRRACARASAPAARTRASGCGSRWAAGPAVARAARGDWTMQTAASTHTRSTCRHLPDRLLRRRRCGGRPRIRGREIAVNSRRPNRAPRACAPQPCTLAPASWAARRSAHLPGDRHRHRRHTRRQAGINPRRGPRLAGLRQAWPGLRRDRQRRAGDDDVDLVMIGLSSAGKTAGKRAREQGQGQFLVEAPAHPARRTRIERGEATSVRPYRTRSTPAGQHAGPGAEEAVLNLPSAAWTRGSRPFSQPL